MVVPTASTGASTLIRGLPKIIVWSFPNTCNRAGLTGTFGETATADDGHLPIFEQVCNDRLKGFDKVLLKYNKESDFTDFSRLNIP